jgi:nucleoside-diphosphate-sugar epimerase
MTVDISKIKNEIGFNPKFDLEVGLKQMFEVEAGK